MRLPTRTEATKRSQLGLSPWAAAGYGAAILGVFLPWSSGAGVRVNGLEGSHNGWIVIVYCLVGLIGLRPLSAHSRFGIALALLGALVVSVILIEDTRPLGVSTAWGLWVTGVGGCAVAGAALIAWRQRAYGTSSKEITAEAASAERLPRGRWRFARAAAAGVVLTSLVVVFGAALQILVVSEETSWPPGPEAITADAAQAATADFLAAERGPREVGLDYAWSTAAGIEPWPEGREFFPRIFADIEAATSSVHILMFGWKPGTVGLEMRDLLLRKRAEGVEVRVLVDSYGAKTGGRSAAMFRTLADAGVEIVVNDLFPLDRDGRIPDRSIDWSQDEVGRAEHRKLYVIDGSIAWTGGAGIEDHFRDGGFHDVMVRVTGDVVRQAQAVFLTSFASHGAAVPPSLDPYFPEPVERGTIPIALTQVVPGGHVAATQSARELIDDSTERLDVMNPYLTDHDIVRRLANAARRGVAVRVVLSETSNNATAERATTGFYRELIDAGVEIWEYPGAVVHAKVIVADDRVQFGTLNLDAWALYRDYEVAMVAESAALADVFETRLFEPGIARSAPAVAPSGAERVASWFYGKIVYFL